MSPRQWRRRRSYALDAEAQILPYYNDYFGTPYPLPKLDNVAGPGQSQFFGAMENWGAIFTFEYVLLDDPAITTRSAQRQAIFGVEAHEMAHQWFGDLVTMAWWDDLWLNEGFASWMATKTTQHFHPDWGARLDRVGVARGRDGPGRAELDPPGRPAGPHRRAGQPGVRRDHLFEGRVGDRDARGFAGPTSGSAASALHRQLTPTRTRGPSDLWARGRSGRREGPDADRPDFTIQPGIPLITVGPAQCVNGEPWRR